MPNHVFSEITLHGVSLDRVKPLILNNKGEISFGVLLPLPINFWPGSAGSIHEKNFPGTHLDAARSTWGTKWDAYGGPEVVEVDGSTVITFQTAWRHPRGWTCALFNTLACRISAAWLDEGHEDACAEEWLQDDPRRLGGPSWRQEIIPKGTAEHRRLHKALWGVEEFEGTE